MDLRERTIKTNGINLHAMEAGPEDGSMILFLHGFPEFWYAWRKQINFFAENGYLVVAPDQRGYNLSDKPDGIESYTLDVLIQDVKGIIDYYKRDQTYLVGHDWGASVAWWMALKYPEHIERMVIMNVPHPDVMITNLKNNPKQVRNSWYIIFFQLPDYPEKLASLDNFSWLINLLESSSRHHAFLTEDLEKYRNAFAQPGAISAMINWYRATMQIKNQRPKDPMIYVPTLILWGVKDVALVPEMADQSMEYCKQGRLIKFEDATHWIQHEESEKVNSLINEHFKQN